VIPNSAEGLLSNVPSTVDSTSWSASPEECLVSKYDIKSQELKSVLVATLCIASSITSELMNLDVLHLSAVCTL